MKSAPMLEEVSIKSQSNGSYCLYPLQNRQFQDEFLILGEDLPTCSFCQNLLPLKDALLDCAGFNPVK